jgi:hypothetical protein
VGDSDRAFELAYEASVRAIEDQASVLESARARAGTILAASALVTSFLGSEALSRATLQQTDQSLHAITFTGAAIASLIVTALLTLAILFPYRMRFSISAREMVGILDARAEMDEPVTDTEALREVALRHEAMYDFNSFRIRILLWCFRGAIVGLVAQVAFWIVVLWRRQL